MISGAGRGWRPVTVEELKSIHRRLAELTREPEDRLALARRIGTKDQDRYGEAVGRMGRCIGTMDERGGDAAIGVGEHIPRRVERVLNQLLEYSNAGVEVNRTADAVRFVRAARQLRSYTESDVKDILSGLVNDLTSELAVTEHEIPTIIKEIETAAGGSKPDRFGELLQRSRELEERQQVIHCELRLRIAEVHITEGNLALAEPLVDDVIRRLPEHGEALNLRGRVRLSRLEVDDAQADFERAMQWDPAPPNFDIRLLNNLALCERTRGNASESTKKFRALVRRCRRNRKTQERTLQTVLINLGESLLAEGDLESAQEAAREVLEAEERRDATALSAHASHLLGLCALRADDLGEAWERLDQACNCYRINGVLLGLARALATKGYVEFLNGMDAALATSDEALQVAHGTGRFIDEAISRLHLGEVLAEHGQLDDAEAELVIARDIFADGCHDIGAAYAAWTLAYVQARRGVPVSSQDLESARAVWCDTDSEHYEPRADRPMETWKVGAPGRWHCVRAWLDSIAW